MSDVYGIKVARPGYSVTNPSLSDANTVFSSEFNTFKIYAVVYFSGAGSEAHGLTYPPTFDFIREYAAGKWVFGNGGYWDNYGPIVSVDDTNVYSTAKAYVILYIDPLNE
jgi:hypothetical protein